MPFRRLLYPFSVLFALIIRIRNFLFDRSLLKSNTFDLPVICIGNLSTGGTGKTPHTEYLIRLLSPNNKLATLSRGYGRSSTGYRYVNSDDVYTDVGDEPLQYKRKFRKVHVAVDEQRANGIQRLQTEINPDLILLDDAFQHRAVKAGLNIIITPWHDAFTKDLLLPAGNLREPRSGSGRADIVIVSKTPASVSESEKEDLAKQIARYTKAKVFYSRIKYDDLQNLSDSKKRIPMEDVKGSQLVLVTGIANAGPLHEKLESLNCSLTALEFRDHKDFNAKEMSQLREIFNNIDSSDK